MIAAARIELLARRALDNRQSALLALAWYAEAKGLCAEWAARRNLALGDVVGLVAALSPQNGWLDQVTWTPRVLQQYGTTPSGMDAAELATHLPGPGFTANKRKAARILKGEDPLDVLSGPKVRAFYVCIMTAGHTEQVCIDRHAWSIAAGLERSSLTLTAKRYRETVAAYHAAAANLRAAYPGLAGRLTAPNVQALTWVYFKENPNTTF